MATAHEVRGRERPPTTGTTPDDRPLTLSEEHGLLLRQVATRAEELLAVTVDGGWPTRELQALLTYMRAEVLRQVVDEGRLLFPSHASSSAVGGLGRDHTTLRLLTEMLAEAAAEERPHHPAQLAATTQELVAHLEHHLNAEQAALEAGGQNEMPGTTYLTRRPHEWYALTEAATIDLDALPASRVVDAVVDRLLRLRSGEEVELHSSRDPYAVWQRMDRLRPGDYGFVYVQDGPDKWLVQVSRRQPAE